MSVIAATAWNQVEQSPTKATSAALVARLQACVDWLGQFARQLDPQPPVFRDVMEDAQEAEDIAMRQTIFCYGASVLALHLMRADGEPNSKERTSFLALFTLAGMGKAKLSSLLAAAAKDEAPVLQYARQINGLLEDEASLRLEFMQRLARLAVVDAPLEPAEVDFLCAVGKIFGFSRPALCRVLIEADSPLAGTPHAVLAVEPTATPAQCQAAYRERVRYCHPDRWQGKEEYKELHRLATLKAAAVNEAYHSLKPQGKRRRR